MIQLGNVKDGGGLGDAGHVKDLCQLLQREDLLFGILALGGPTQQRHIVQNGFGQITLCLQILITGVTMALGHLVLGVPHNRGAVDVDRHLPAEGMVQQVILGSGGQVFTAPHHMGNAHQMIVDHIGKVIGGQAVPLQQHLIVQRAVFHRDVAEDGVMESGGTFGGDLLTDDVWLTGLHPLEGLLQRQIAAGIGGPVKFAGILLGFRLFAEAVVGTAFFHQQAGIAAIGVPALRLDIGGHGAAHIGAFVVVKTALGHGAVDHVHGALHQTALVGILDPQNKGAAVIAGDQPGIQRRAQVTHMHIAGGRRRETGTHLSVRNFFLHLGKIVHIHRHFFHPPAF